MGLVRQPTVPMSACPAMQMVGLYLMGDRMSVHLSTRSRSGFRWRAAAPSGRTVRFALTLVTIVVLSALILGAAIIVSWLFLAYNQGQLIEKVLLVVIGAVSGLPAGAGGLLGYQRL